MNGGHAHILWQWSWSRHFVSLNWMMTTDFFAASQFWFSKWFTVLWLFTIHLHLYSLHINTHTQTHSRGDKMRAKYGSTFDLNKSKSWPTMNLVFVCVCVCAGVLFNRCAAAFSITCYIYIVAVHKRNSNSLHSIISNAYLIAGTQAYRCSRIKSDLISHVNGNGAYAKTPPKTSKCLSPSLCLHWKNSASLSFLIYRKLLLILWYCPLFLKFTQFSIWCKCAKRIVNYDHLNKLDNYELILFIISPVQLIFKKM